MDPVGLTIFCKPISLLSRLPQKNILFKSDQKFSHILPSHDVHGTSRLEKAKLTITEVEKQK
jgi:hypothetical protein